MMRIVSVKGPPPHRVHNQQDPTGSRPAEAFEATLFSRVVRASELRRLVAWQGKPYQTLVHELVEAAVGMS